jgi:hypothetical protein
MIAIDMEMVFWGLESNSGNDLCKNAKPTTLSSTIYFDPWVTQQNVPVPDCSLAGRMGGGLSYRVVGNREILGTNYCNGLPFIHAFTGTCDTLQCAPNSSPDGGGFHGYFIDFLLEDGIEYFLLVETEPADDSIPV